MHILRRFHAPILLTLLCLCITACGDTQSTASTTVNTNTSNHSAILGSPLSTFDAKFGDRGTTIDDKGGSYTWNTKYGDLDLYIDTLNSVTLTDTAKNFVNGLLFSFPYNASATSNPVLTNKAAIELSTLFLPPDTVHMKDVYSQSLLVNGEAILIKMYYSRQLATLLPATSFVDHNGNQLKRGLITILFSLNNGNKNQITDVTVQSGEDLPKGFNA